MLTAWSGTMLRMSHWRVSFAGAVAAILSACHGVEAAPSDPVIDVVQAGLDPVVAACRDLHDAPAHLWGERLADVMSFGARSEAPLLEQLSERPAAAGAQASLAALARVGGAAAVAHCRRVVTERGTLAVEAALALGVLPGRADDASLLGCLDDPFTDVTLRAAAACSLARQGERERAPRWIGAIVRAGTPAGRADEQALGIPIKERWARERYFVQRTLLALGHDDLLQGFDTDSSWRALESIADRIEMRLRAP